MDVAQELLLGRGELLVGQGSGGVFLSIYSKTVTSAVNIRQIRTGTSGSRRTSR
jgi:hypothetical protein